jgi:hypothetical protein
MLNLPKIIKYLQWCSTKDICEILLQFQKEINSDQPSNATALGNDIINEYKKKRM